MNVNDKPHLQAKSARLHEPRAVIGPRLIFLIKFRITEECLSQMVLEKRDFEPSQYRESHVPG